jgi:hypothetical protein
MTTHQMRSDDPAVLDRSIDRFLRAEGWRVTEVRRSETTGGYQVTLSRGNETPSAQTVTRSASSAGEATLMACSSARRLGSVSA